MAHSPSLIDLKLKYEANILALALDKRRDVFALQLDCLLEEPLQLALDRLLRRGWVRLLDIVKVNGITYRYFHVSDTATSWYHQAWVGRN